MMNVEANAIEIIADQTPGLAHFYNFDEVKTYLSQGLSIYKTTAYTPDNLPQAQKDLKELKAIRKKLTDKKKELEAAYTLPIEEVKKQLDELIDMVKEPLDYIDKMVKEVEKAAKEKDILAYAKEKASVLGAYAEKVLGSEAFFNPKWLNSTYSTKNWRADIDQIVKDASDAIQSIQRTGGKNTSALMGLYFDKLSLEGADKFLETIGAANDSVVETQEDTEDTVVGYKVLKVYGTQRQMLQLLSEMDLSGLDYEELEDGMPQPMHERTDVDFDSFVAFDIEHSGTFGIDNGDADAEIIEIGAVKVVDGIITERFDMLANPGRKIVPQVARLTHITDEMVKNEPPVDEVIRAFRAFVGDNILLGHNVKSCDIPHIVRAAKRAGVAFGNEFFDTKPMAMGMKEKYGWKDVKLPTLSAFYGVEQSEAHRAWCDAEANAQVFLQMKRS